MKYDGLGEKALFFSFHPIVTFVYFVCLIIAGIFFNHPLFYGCSLCSGIVYAGVLKGTQTVRNHIFLFIFLAIFMSVINGLFSHNGMTVLFFLNNNRITVEAITYGAVLAMMITSLIIWFGILQVLLSPDKIIYLFGRILPSLALTISLVLRFIPLLRRRAQMIHEAQVSMGRGKEKKLFHRIRQRMKEISILIAWSMESSIETGDAMEARGYGLLRRTSFHLYHFHWRDTLLLLVIAVICVPVVYGIMQDAGKVYYFPGYHDPSPFLLNIVTLAFYVGLLVLPLVLDVIGELQWKRYVSKM